MASLHPTLTERVASAGHVNVEGVFYRHAAPGRDAFAGGQLGRWGDTFPVIYLGRPETSVVVEAYRHLVDEQGIPPSSVRPRIEYTVPVRVTRILDLTDPHAVATTGLTETELLSDVGEYESCQAVAAAAHQLRLHGILAPAATGLGQTLALFRRNLPATEIPIPSLSTKWEQLPADPRQLRALNQG